MLNKDNLFYQIINKLDMNFFWIGNEYEPCNGTMENECFYNYKNENTFIPNLIFTTESFYKKSIFSYLYYYFLNNIKKDLFISAYDFLENLREVCQIVLKKIMIKQIFILFMF